MVIVDRPPEHAEDLSISLLIDQLLAAGTGDLYAEMMRRMDRLLIKRIPQHTDGNQRRAAQILGITRGCLRNKLRTLGITISRVVEGAWGVKDPASLDAPYGPGSDSLRCLRSARAGTAAGQADRGQAGELAAG